MAVISVRQLGKEYRLGSQMHDTLRDHLAAALRGGRREEAQRFWALREVSFDVEEGEVVGVIGRNGAGKSTLLKILSQITEPTEGEVRLRGRMASLLEVGTGFHPELSGRENVFLNGAILGMSRREIRSKFDEIVAFSEIEEFIDTPVKRYSSGMQVRLAFAVAAHLDSEILVIDEVLAVGDASFQRKCLRKMDEAATRAGRTVIFVSHNLAAVQQLCSRGIFLEHGRLGADESIATALDRYQRSLESDPQAALEIAALQPGEMRSVSWQVAGGEGPHTCATGALCEFHIQVVSRTVIDDGAIGCVLWNASGEIVASGNTTSNEMPLLRLDEGRHLLIVRVRLPIRGGLYQLDVSLNSEARGQLDRAFLEPKLHILPPETTLPEKWQGMLTEKMEFQLHRGSG